MNSFPSCLDEFKWTKNGNMKLYQIFGLKKYVPKKHVKYLCVPLIGKLSNNMFPIFVKYFVSVICMPSTLGICPVLWLFSSSWQLQGDKIERH